MKPMIYDVNRKIEILDEGIYKDYHYIIISYGSHPCAYVEIKDNDKCKSYEWINCHGGITFRGYRDDREGFYIGWDYNHYMDYCDRSYNYGSYSIDVEYSYALHMEDYKRWTTEEIFEEVKNVIEQLIEND